MNNLAGYDISPDMVKLALVNMYLHGFPEPKIHEYDTLSSEKRWDETFDVIMANPPFMSPKGGIVPHKRFSIQANRAEVLFVDYIVEHLTIKGRAGIIVPEGVIFQSNNAYTQLRKKLVEDGLFAVVSLPAGVFNPYAGVKTSVLLFDNSLAKKTNEILFLKIQNDGFDLDAQRREHSKNDLPLALEIIKKYKSALNDNKAFKFSESEKQIAHLVAKEKIAETGLPVRAGRTQTGDYNLTGERYKEVVNFVNHKWPMVELNEVCEFIGGYAFKSEELKKEKEHQEYFPIIKIGNVDKSGILDISDAHYFEYQDFLKKYLIKKDDILVAMTGATVGKVACSQFDNLLLNQRVGLIRAVENKILKSFLKSLLLSEKFYEYCQLQAGGGAQGNISPTQIQRYKIPLPPIKIQKEIIEQIEVKQNAIDHAKAIIQNLERERRYFGQALRKLEGVEMVNLSDVCEINRKTAEPTKLFGKDAFAYIDISSVENGTGNLNYENMILPSKAPSRARRIIQNGDVLLSTVRPNLKAFAYLENLPSKALASTGFAVLTAKDNVLAKYIFHLLFADDLQNQMAGRMGKGSYPSINQDDVEQLSIPLPTLEIQKKLVAEAEKEQQIINASKQLIEIYDQKISDVLSEI